MAHTVVYGKKHRVLKADHRPLGSVSLWMVREGEMVRESYLLPAMPPDQTYGLLDFSDLRLVVDPHAPTGPDARGGSSSSMGRRVVSRILRRGADLSAYNFRVQPEQPVPCEAVAQEAVAGDGGCVGNGEVVGGWLSRMLVHAWMDV